MEPLLIDDLQGLNEIKLAKWMEKKATLLVFSTKAALDASTHKGGRPKFLVVKADESFSGATTLYFWNGSTATLVTQGNGAAPKAVTAAYTVSVNDSTITATGAPYTVTLPSAVGIAGKRFIVKNLSASGTITVGTTSSQTIDGSTTYALASQNKYVEIQSNGVNYIVVGNN